jgi:Protein of unknown function (DUF1064)
VSKTETLTLEQYRKEIGQPSKQGRNRANVPTEVDGERFPSKKQANRYQDLKLMQKAGKIRKLRREVLFPLIVNGWPIYEGGYRADATYYETVGDLEVYRVEDSKGFATETYLHKKRLMKAIYGIVILET